MFTRHSLLMSRPIVFVGPSGIGKGTIEKAIMAANPDRFAFSVSHTTRKPREGEVDGVAYNFTTLEQMEKEIQEGKFLEFCKIHGNLYGTSFAAIEKVTSTGKFCIIDINIDGAISIKEKGLNPFIIFLKPVSLEALEARLKGRGTESDDVVAVRMQTAREEMERHDQMKDLWDLSIVNDKMEDTLNTIYAALKEHVGYEP